MNFSEWLPLNEGFTIDTSKIPHDELQAAVNAIVSTNAPKEKSIRKNELIHLLYEKGRFKYSAKDSPSDLLRVSAVDTSREISYVDDLKHPLRTFKAKIYYGFEFPTIFAFGDTHASMPIHDPKTPITKPKQEPDWRGDVWRMGNAQTDKRPGSQYVQDARVVNSPSYRAVKELRMQVSALEQGDIAPFMLRPAGVTEAKVRPIVGLDTVHGQVDPEEMMRLSPEERAARLNKMQFVSPTGYPVKPIQPPKPPPAGYQHSMYGDPITFKPYNLSPDYNVARQQAVKLLATLRQRLEKMEYEQQAVTDKINPMGHFQTKEETETYYQTMRTAMAKMFKEPPPGQEGVVEQFCDIAIKNFMRLMPKKYDYVLYPESSKPFNKQFAAKMAKALGAQALEAFHKRPNNKITLNKRELRARHPNQDTYDNNVNWLQTNIDRAKRSKKPMKISSVKPKDHRKYFNLFSMDEGDYAGKNILIIDDNVDAGGTFEILYSMVISKKPASIDVYAPLRMTDHHH